MGTIRSVVKGILGVAVIQAAMAGLGFFVAGVPYAGVWTVACLFFAIIQIGAGPVAIPIMIYMFSVTDTLTAVLLAVWLVITLISDNILKPLLLGRGAPAPMLVVFLGATVFHYQRLSWIVFRRRYSYDRLQAVYGLAGYV